MDYYYYNYVWNNSVGIAMPTVLRARARYQPGLLRPRNRSIQLPCWLIDALLLPGTIRCRVGSSQRWESRHLNELFLYQPYTPFDEVHEPEPERANTFIMFSGGELAGLEKLFAPGERYVKLFDPERKIINKIVDLARMGTLEGEASFWKAQLLLYEILGLMQTTRRNNKPNELEFPASSVTGNSGLAARADRLLLDHIAEPLTREMVARELGMSVSSLSHKYLQLTGKTLMQRRMELRLQQVRSMLDSGRTLAELAAQTGFSSGFHLSRAFKQHYGVSPRDYCAETESQQ